MMVILFVLGAIVGSFLNVAGLRYRSGRGVGGRSFCFVCERQLQWFELIPVVSFLGLGGKCRSCKTAISWQYPFVEAVTGIIFISGFALGLTPLAYLAFIVTYCLYIVIGIYDAKHTTIPDELVYTSVVTAGIFAWALGDLASGVWGALASAAFFLLIWVVTRGRALGLGDVKLAASTGLLLGLPNAISGIAFAFWIGTILTLLAMIFSRKKLTMKSEIPFAPFIIAGAWLAQVLDANLFHISLFAR